MTELPAVITELRRAWIASGETLASVGQRAGGLAPQSVSASLRGTYDIRLSSLARLAHVLGFDVALIPARHPGARPTGTGWPA